MKGVLEAVAYAAAKDTVTGMKQLHAASLDEFKIQKSIPRAAGPREGYLYSTEGYQHGGGKQPFRSMEPDNVTTWPLFLRARVQE